ncbi:MAG: hypothetical protein E6K78_12070 [Candidatus Eisenbacteria bacterium]|uniref:Mutator family transposase n=1 Tax=Eiseniibacteriota bacterium TaxID=2212470 RepID=A0A538TEW7_UNCEI|nr:MAG: hypothetical protein E6K78_12070 [Candidatus Eisenbacteria bacterium]
MVEATVSRRTTARSSTPKTSGRARRASLRLTTKWKKRCPAVVESLDEAGDELLTFYRFPESQWKGLRTTNIVERVIEEFRRRVKAQAVLP